MRFHFFAVPYSSRLRDPLDRASYSRNNPGFSRDQVGMKNTILVVGPTLSVLGSASAQEAPPRNEVGLSLGGLFRNERSGGATRLDLGSGVALQANYAYRIFGHDEAALYGEVHLLANPLRDVGSSAQTLTRDVATLFVTPGIRVKFFPSYNAPTISADSTMLSQAAVWS